MHLSFEIYNYVIQNGPLYLRMGTGLLGMICRISWGAVTRITSSKYKCHIFILEDFILLYANATILSIEKLCIVFSMHHYDKLKKDFMALLRLERIAGKTW